MEELIVFGVSQLSICLYVFVCVWSTTLWMQAISGKERPGFTREGWLSQPSSYYKKMESFLKHPPSGNKLPKLIYMSDPVALKKEI